MSADFYNNLASVASRLLTKFGQDVVFRSSLTVNPLTGALTGTQTDVTTKGIFKKIPDNLVDGTRIKSTDKMVVINNSYTPTMSDRVIMGTDIYTIQEIHTSSPAGVDLVYGVRLRK